MYISDAYLPFIIGISVIVIVAFATAIASMLKAKEAKQNEERKRAEARKVVRTAPPTAVAPKKQTVVRDRMKSNMKPNLKTSPTPTVSSHTHPAESGKFKVEKAYIEGGGESYTEGCDEHYLERFVSLPTAQSENNEPNAELARLIILGECLAHPKYHNPMIRPKE